MMFSKSIFLLAAILFATVGTIHSFSVLPSSTSAITTHTSTSSSTSSTSLNNFFKNAFANDDSLGKPENAGLKNGPKKNDNVTINGKKVNAVVGQKVSVVAAQSRVKITYSCNKGDCGTCEVYINGRVQKACQAVIPSGKCDIKTP